ncbi:ankyrin repeat domain-containing protein [Endozoicomonas sp. ONNA2]|uniref:ankyrin repeat domain-containing protein n=1 Tax=Endozoicomonas sp. ONNA2 TaxID=2828741 RepID=UPI002147D66B|nr:ankyrin repeat domain-containing protein [Endozoicomonas sp. ONNA2]
MNIQGNTNNPPSNTISHDEGRRASQFAQWPRVELSEDKHQFLTDGIPQTDEHGQPNLKQRSCADYQHLQSTSEIPPLKIKPDSVAMQGPEQSLQIHGDRCIDSANSFDLLFKAFMKNEVEEVMRLCKAGADLNARGMSGTKPIHQAVLFDRSDCLQTLIEFGADVNDTDDLRRTPLHHAARKGKPNSLTLLLNNDQVEVNATAQCDWSPLHHAVWENKIGSVIALLNHEKVNANALHDDQQTPLHFAACRGFNKIVLEMLKHRKVDVNAKDVFGNTPLHCAAASGKIDSVIALLTSTEVDINATNKLGFTPLDQAIKENRIPCKELLLEKGAKTWHDLGWPCSIL